MKRAIVIGALMIIFMVTASVRVMASTTNTASFKVSVTIPAAIGMNETLTTSDTQEARLISEWSLRDIQFTVLVRNSQEYLVKSIVLR